MSRLFKKLPSFANVAAGNDVTLNLPIGRTYDAIHIKYSGVALPQLKNIVLKINGKPVQEYRDGQRLQDLNKHYGRNVKTGVLTWWFVRPEMQTLAEQRAFALGTQGVGTATIEMSIDSGAPNPNLSAIAIQSNPRPLVMLTKVKTYPVSWATAGQQEIDRLPRPPQARIAAIHLFKDDISDVELEVDSFKAYELSKTMGAGIQVDYGRNPQTSKATVIDMTLEGDPRQSLSLAGVQDLRIRPTIASAGSCDVMVEYFDGLGGI